MLSLVILSRNPVEADVVLMLNVIPDSAGMVFRVEIQAVPVHLLVVVAAQLRLLPVWKT